MGNDAKAVRRSKEEKKVLKKQIKASHTLLKHEGVRTAPQPTKVTGNNAFRNRKWPLSDREERPLTCTYYFYLTI